MIELIIGVTIIIVLLYVYMEYSDRDDRKEYIKRWEEIRRIEAQSANNKRKRND